MVESVRPTRILVPTDFSPGADVALGWAQSLAAAFGAGGILLHVVDLSIAALAGVPRTLAGCRSSPSVNRGERSGEVPGDAFFRPQRPAGLTAGRPAERGCGSPSGISPRLSPMSDALAEA